MLPMFSDTSIFSRAFVHFTRVMVHEHNEVPKLMTIGTITFCPGPNAGCLSYVLEFETLYTYLRIVFTNYALESPICTACSPTL